MFTGIIETIGEIVALDKEGENLHIKVKSSLAQELNIDQSVSHNGVCLTVVEIDGGNHVVTAIKETLDKSNMGDLQVDSRINLERAMKLGDRLDGHIVQGHVDQKGVCKAIEEMNGSSIYTFTYDDSYDNVTIEKGSITIDGVSLTVINSGKDEFSVAIIPYTYEQTNFGQLKIGVTVNLEFDVIGKYLKKLSQGYF